MYTENELSSCSITDNNFPICNKSAKRRQNKTYKAIAKFDNYELAQQAMLGEIDGQKWHKRKTLKKEKKFIIAVTVTVTYY